jgi:hypothetical protein
MGKPVIPVVRRCRFGKHPVTPHAARPFISVSRRFNLRS